MKALLLAAGLGSRLKPLTNEWPKCLMPINGKPLLEIWLDSLFEVGIKEILVNVHHHSKEVIDFLSRKKFEKKISWVYEANLLGTAGTLIKNKDFFGEHDILLIHSDNLCLANLNSFINCHKNKPKSCLMTMMTFESEDPSSCGIVEINSDKICLKFHEKVDKPPSNLANAAVYILDNSLLKKIIIKKLSDFSLEVIPSLLGKILTWKNDNLHIDIGKVENLINAQDKIKRCEENSNKNLDQWQKRFLKNDIHTRLEKLMLQRDA